MIILDNVTVADAFPSDIQSGGAQMFPAFKSNGGYFEINNNPVYIQLAYSIEPSDYGQGQTAWTKPAPFPIGPGILAPGTVGIRFKNYTPGQAAIVSGALAEHSEPPIAVTSSGSTNPTVTLVPVVLSLPGSPTNQQQIIYTDSLVSPTYNWLLQFDSGLTTPGWIFLGGSPIRSNSASLVLPRAGTWDIRNTYEITSSQTAPVTGGMTMSSTSGAFTGIITAQNNWSAATGTGVTTLSTNGELSARLAGNSVGATVSVAATGSASVPAYNFEATPVIITG